MIVTAVKLGTIPIVAGLFGASLAQSTGTGTTINNETGISLGLFVGSLLATGAAASTLGVLIYSFKQSFAKGEARMATIERHLLDLRDGQDILHAQIARLPCPRNGKRCDVGADVPPAVDRTKEDSWTGETREP